MPLGIFLDLWEWLLLSDRMEFRPKAINKTKTVECCVRVCVFSLGFTVHMQSLQALWLFMASVKEWYYYLHYNFTTTLALHVRM